MGVFCLKILFFLIIPFTELHAVLKGKDIRTGEISRTQNILCTEEALRKNAISYQYYDDGESYRGGPLKLHSYINCEPVKLTNVNLLNYLDTLNERYRHLFGTHLEDYQLMKRLFSRLPPHILRSNQLKGPRNHFKNHRIAEQYYDEALRTGAITTEDFDDYDNVPE